MRAKNEYKTRLAKNQQSDLCLLKVLNGDMGAEETRANAIELLKTE